MSFQLALITGLAVLVFLTHKSVEKFLEDETEDVTRAFYVLSMLPLIGLTWTGYGIAQNQSLSNGETAYLVALLYTVLAFTGMIVLYAGKILEEINDSGSRLDTL